jgi:hypothetical protein
MIQLPAQRQQVSMKDLFLSKNDNFNYLLASTTTSTSEYY